MIKIKDTNQGRSTKRKACFENRNIFRNDLYIPKRTLYDILSSIYTASIQLNDAAYTTYGKYPLIYSQMIDKIQSSLRFLFE
jgi:hypothetical protein